MNVRSGYPLYRLTFTKSSQPNKEPVPKGAEEVHTPIIFIETNVSTKFNFRYTITTYRYYLE
jgi:hypothetical protein